MEEKYCQSCAMPMGQTSEMYGTEKNGSKSTDYCKYCYHDGKFIKDETMDEMIKSCIPHVISANKDMTEKTARAMMDEIFPILKRWRNSK